MRVLTLCIYKVFSWEIIADRHEFEGRHRSVNEIKARFFEIEDTVNILNGYKGPLNCFNFKEEEERKECLRRFLYRSSKEIQEDEDAMKEMEKLRKLIKYNCYQFRKSEI